MAKKLIKADSSRKPPEPSTHAEIEAWITRVMPDLNPVVSWLDATISATLPEPQFALKWRRAYYGVPGKGWVIELVAYDVSVNVLFLGGADFDSPPPLGETGRTRYVKVRSLEEAQAPEMRRWIEQAARAPGWK